MLPEMILVALPSLTGSILIGLPIRLISSVFLNKRTVPVFTKEYRHSAVFLLRYCGPFFAWE